MANESSARMGQTEDESTKSIGGNLSVEAKNDLRAFSRFYLWASPLFELGHVTVKGNSISFSQLISKRLSVGAQNNIPAIGFQASELAWARTIPWAWAAVNINSKTIFLVATPAEPLNTIIFVIQVDSKQKIMGFKGMKKLLLIDLAGSVGSEPCRIEIDLKEIDDEQLSKPKLKIKPPAFVK